MMINKKLWLALIIVLAVIAGGLIYWQSDQPKVSAYEFVGQVNKIDGNTVSMNGAFVIKDHPELGKKDSLGVDVSLTANTKFQKTVLYLPTTTTTFTTADLKKDIKTVSLDEFKTDLTNNKVNISVHSDKNIYNSQTFSASGIDYILPFSEPVQPSKK